MADDQPLSPLDDAFVSSLVRRVGVEDYLIGAAAQRHWKAVLARFPVARFVAERFNLGEWVGDEDWFVDPGIQEVFRGYDWRRYTGQERPTTAAVATQGQVQNTAVQNNQAGGQPAVNYPLLPQITPAQNNQAGGQSAFSYPLLPQNTLAQNTPVQNNQAGGQPTVNYPLLPQITPAQNNQAGGQSAFSYPLLPQNTLAQNTPVQNNQAGGQPTVNYPLLPQITPAQITPVQNTPVQNNQASGQPAVNYPLLPQITPVQNNQAGGQSAFSYPMLPQNTPAQITPAQNSQAGRQPAQNAQTRLPNTAAQNSQAGRQPALATYPLQPPNTRGQNNQSGRQTAQNIPTPQSQSIPTGSRSGQNAPPRQNPVTPGRQGLAQPGAAGLTLPTPQTQNVPTGSRPGQNIPPRQNPVTPGRQGQAQLGAGGLALPTPQTQNVPTGSRTGQNIPPRQNPVTPGRQGLAQPGAAGLTPGPDVANSNGSPNVNITANMQGNPTGQQTQTTGAPVNAQGALTGQQLQAAINAAANVRNNHRGRQPRLPGVIPPVRQGNPTGQQPQTANGVPVNTQGVPAREGPQNNGDASGVRPANTLAALAAMSTPQSQQRPAGRLPSPLYDDQLDPDRHLPQAQAQPQQQAPAPADDGSIPPPLQPSPEDMERPHTWKGQRLPALGVRLTHLKNFLCDEDIDRDISWKEHIDEAEEYLNHIKSNREFWHIGLETRDMVDRLLEMVAAHRLFEKYHYGTFISTKIITPDMVNKPAPRLRYDPDLPIVLNGKGRPGSRKAHEIMPGDFPDQPRRQGLVNNMWLTARENQAGLTGELRAQHQLALARAEDVWWQLEPGQAPPDDNLSAMENKMYEDIVAADFGRGMDGWVNISPAADGGPGLTRWCAGPTFLQDCAGSFARERGARRAGLQGALRQFRNMENQLACTPWRRLVLPPTAEELRLARESAGAGDGRKWPLIPLEHGKMRKTEGKDDPQGFTVAMAQFWRDQQVLLLQARETVTGNWGGRGVGAGLGDAPHPQWVTPPVSIWGPYVWRAVDSDTQNHQDMLKQMRAAKKLLDRDLRIAPRQLLRHMDALYNLGYANQGLHQGSIVFQDPQTKFNVAVNLHPRRDVTDGNFADLDKMEMYWIRFILNNSITTLMTEQLEPRTSMYVVFAERLNSIFNDISDPLFPCNGTKVSVEDLLDYMHKKTDGPVKRVNFYAHDAQRWLARLAAQGRCRYEDDWRCYGWVQRPVPDCHPENLINWQVTDQDENTDPREYPEDMVFAPRLKDLRTWGDIINDGQPPNFLDGNVNNYFQCLAYRWGRYMHKLENPDNGLERGWKTKAAEPHDNMQYIIDDIEIEYRDLVGWNQVDDSWDNNPLVSLVKRTLPEKTADATVCPGASIQIIRDHVINEAMRNDTMLWPARNAYRYNDIYDEKVRPPLWDWAKVEVRGPVKKFFDVNRWPLQLQTEDTQRRIKSDQDLSVQQLWNPITEDPTPWKLYRPKARPYVDEKVKYREGHRIYPIGDTPRQKKVIENQMYATIGRAMGLPDTAQARPGLMSRLSGLFRRGGNDDDDDHARPGSRLPRVKPKDIPKSYNPRAEADRKRKAVDDARDGATKVARLTGDQLLDNAIRIGDPGPRGGLVNGP